MIFLFSLASKQLNKASKFQNWIDMARLDWKLIKIWKFDFVQNQIWLALISDWFFLKLTPNPSSINVQCIHIKKERKNWLKNPKKVSKKLVKKAISISVLQANSRSFEDWISILKVPGSYSNHPHALKRPESSQPSHGLCQYNLKSNPYIQPCLMCFDCIFVLLMVFLSFLHSLI